MKNSLYLDIMLQLMQLTLIDEAPQGDLRVGQALDILTEQTFELAQLSQIQDREMLVSNKLPIGYLLKSFLDWQIAIPWPMSESFPNDVTLAEFCAFATAVRVGIDSSICLSGTSARTSEIPEIGDIDFAEYVFDLDLDFKERLLEVLRGKPGLAVPVEFKLVQGSMHSGSKIDCPWPLTETAYTQKHHDIISLAPSSQSKIDFLGQSTAYGRIPITNMILPSSKDEYKTGFAENSYSFQEAVLLPGLKPEAPVWPLMQVAELVGYACFLVRDSRKYAPTNPLKAAKRASALGKFLFMHDFDEAFADILASDYARATAINDRQREVDRMVRKLEMLVADRSDIISADLTDLNGLNAIMEHHDDTYDELESSCRSLVEKFLNDIMSRVRSFDPRLERTLDNSR
jgi:hypothetical protein